MNRYFIILCVFSLSLSTSIIPRSVNPADSSYIYLKLAEKYKSEENYTEAVKLMERSLSFLSDSCSIYRAAVLNTAGNIYNNTGNYPKARIHLQNALSCARSFDNTEGKNDTLLLNILNNLGDLDGNLGQNQEALSCYSEALSIAKKNNLTAETSSILNNTGLIYHSLGQYDKAIEYIKNSLKLTGPDTDKKRMMSKLNNLGQIYLTISKYDSSKAYFESSLELAKELDSKEYIASVKNNIGGLCFSLGQYEKAITYFEESLAIGRQMGQEDKIGRKLNNLGLTYQYVKNYDKALECYQESLEITRRLEQYERLPSVLSNIGSLLRIQKKYDEAMKYYNEAMALDRKQNRQGDIAVDLNNIGYIYMLTGKTHDAVKNFEEALKIMGQKAPSQKSAGILKNLGMLYYDKSDYRRAAEYFTRAIDQLETVRKTTKGTARRDYLASQIGTYRFLTMCYLKRGMEKEAVNTLEQSTARYLLEQIAKKQNSEVSPAVDVVRYQKSIPTESVLLYFTNYENVPGMASFCISSDTICAATRDTCNELNGTGEKYREIIDELFAGSISQTKAKPDANRIISFYRYLLSLPSPSISEVKMTREIASALYSFLIGDFEKYISDKKEITIIPGGALTLIPFETLIMPDGRYLIEKYNIKYCQSMTVSTILNSRKRTGNADHLLGFGGAVYDSTAAGVYSEEKKGETDRVHYLALKARAKGENMLPFYNSLGYGYLPNIPATLLEMKVLKRLYPDSRILTGKEATERTLKQISAAGELKQYGIIHFATHGLVIPDLPELSALVFSRTDMSDSAANDGYLDMQEIADLDIHADFVNLSACETGTGKIYNGEGIWGLTESFIIAGANSVGVSLWKVEDTPTAAFMAGMYSMVKRHKKTYSEAITDMKRRFINGAAYSAPFYWAPFIYYGN